MLIEHILGIVCFMFAGFILGRMSVKSPEDLGYYDQVMKK